MNPQGEQDGPLGQLSRILRAVRRRWWLIAAMVAVAGIAAYLLSSSQTKQYEATANIYISQSDPVNAVVGTSDSRPPDPERDFNSKVDLITQPEVAAAVRKQLGIGGTDADLLTKVTTEVAGSTDIVGIKAQDPDPRRAADIANGFAEQFVLSRQRAVRGAILEAVSLAQRQLDEMTQVERDAPQGRELAARLRELQIAAALQTGGIERVSDADVPSSPASPRPLLMTILAMFLAGLLGVAIAVALELLDRRIRDESVLDRYDPPVLAAVPAPTGGDTPLDEQFAVREALSTLATNLRFLNLGRDVNSIVVTSPGPQEGKTTVTLGLSRALTQLGLRVITIEADLRRPLFTTYTDVRPAAGLSTVLAGVSDLEEALVDIDAHTFAPLDGAEDQDTPYFTVLPAGPVPPNPLGLLSSPAMSAVVRRLRAMADVVVIDTAPVGTVNDAVAIGELVDGIVLLAKLGQTRRDVLERTIRTFEHLPTPLLGFVVTNAQRRDEGSYYGYDRPYRARAAETA